MIRKLPIAVALVASLGSSTVGQIRIGGTTGNYVFVQVDPSGGTIKSNKTLLGPPPIIGPIDVNHHLACGGNVAEAVFMKSSSNMFICAGSWTPLASPGKAKGRVRFLFRNLSPTPVWFTVTGFISHNFPDKLNGFHYYSTSGGGSRDYPLSAAIAFRDKVPGNGSGYFQIDTFAQGRQRRSQVILDVSMSATECARQTISNNANGMVPGQGGLPPILSIEGCSITGPVNIALRVVKPNANSLLFIGLPTTGLPVLGGILFPSLPGLSVPVTTGPANSMGFGGWSIPVKVPLGTTGSFSLQTLVLDSAAVQGVAFSNTLTLTLK